MEMKKKTLDISLPVIIFKEGRSYVAYSPALDLSTSASTYEKAQKRFSEAVDIFFEELSRLGTTNKVLGELGWQQIKSDWHPPVVVSNYLQQIKLSYA